MECADSELKYSYLTTTNEPYSYGFFTLMNTLLTYCICIRLYIGEKKPLFHMCRSSAFNFSREQMFSYAGNQRFVQ